jgi:thiol-disulfide isomerase/thioredoxin
MSKPTPYASFANYNNNNNNNNTDLGSNYKKMGPEEPVKPLNGGIRPQDKNPPQPEVQPDPKLQMNPQHTQHHPNHRVREIKSEKLFELLSTPMYHFTPQETPLKILVKVYTDWCKPCQQVAPAIEELSVSPEFSDILFVQLNGEKICENLKTMINVSAVPVFFGFVAGRKIGDFIAGPDVGKVVDLCRRMNEMKVTKK